VGGATTTSKINSLNAGAWAQLVSSQAQVTAITADEILTLTANVKIAPFGANFQYLSNAALGALSATQINYITATEIFPLAPAQVRFVGSTGVGGATTTSKINSLNAGAWAQLVLDPLQVGGITAAEILTLTANVKIAPFDVNFQYLTDAALGALTATQKIYITAAEKSVLSPAQHTACGC
jgi:hypothetical protein